MILLGKHSRYDWHVWTSPHEATTIPAMSGSSLALPLSRRPDATTIRVKELIEKVRSGAIRVPAFQRPLRWKSKDVVALLDSVWRGYPMGSLLFWKRRADAEEIRVGSANLSVPTMSDAWWLVDGQQRTTALAASLLDLNHGGDRRWTASFDPQTNEFRDGDPRPEEEGIVVPVSTLGDLRRLGRWIRESGAEDELVEIVEDAQQRLLDYSIPAYIVETEDERILREVFARLNSTGARMRGDEIFHALHGGSAASSSQNLDLEQLARNCDLDGFGQPPRSDVMKVILAITGQDPNRKLTTSIDAIANLPPASEVENALARTRIFLQDDCNIPWFGLLPYPVTFILLARWFYLFPESDDGVRTNLRHWLWRSAISGAHQRAEVTKMRDQVRDLVEGDLEGSGRRLLERVKHLDKSDWRLERFHHTNARSRIEILALLSQSPRDENGRLTVQSLLAETYGRVAREIFAASDLKGVDDETRNLAKSAANRVILGGVHTGLQSKLRYWFNQSDLLSSHLIDGEAKIFLEQGDIKSFLEHRAKTVCMKVNLFLHENAAFNEPVVHPSSYYLELDDGDEQQ